MELTGGFHWFHRSFGKVNSSEVVLTLWVTYSSAVLTELLSLFPSGWEIPPSYPRLLSFFHPTIYIPFSSSEEMHVTFSEVSFSPISDSAESKQLVTLQHVASAMHQGAFCIQGVTDGTQQPLLTRREKEMSSLSQPTTVSFIVTVLLQQQFPVFLKPDWASERERKRAIFMPKE